MVIIQEKEVYSLWLNILRNFPRVERFGIGYRLDQSLLSLLEYTLNSAYLPTVEKIIALRKTISKLDAVKFFVQLAWENKLIPTEKHSELSVKLEEIGRMLGGWKKGLETKLPAK